MTGENLDSVQQYEAAKLAFERGNYRQCIDFLEGAIAQVEPTSNLGGEMQMWLVTAYKAGGKSDEAIALCRKLTRHPRLTTRQQAKRVLFVLEAPKLNTNKDWVVEIPDLKNLSESDSQSKIGRTENLTPVTPAKKKFVIEPVSPDEMNTPPDNQFIWVALGVIGLAVLVLMGLNLPNM